MTTTRVHSVPGMSCDRCVKAITDHVTPLDGVTCLVVDLEAKTVTVTGGDDVAVVAAIDEAGFDVA
jgi:copper chaperone CopZ